MKNQSFFIIFLFKLQIFLIFPLNKLVSTIKGIYLMSVNYIYNYLKKRSIHARYIESQIHKDEIYSNHTDEQVLFNDLERSLNSVIGILPSQQQKIFQLNHYEGLSHKEIALKLDLSVRTVENQMYRAQKTIRTILMEKYF